MNELKEAILNGYLATKEDIEILKESKLSDLISAAKIIRDYYHNNNFDFCTIINAKSGKCSENCKFCAQSSYYITGIEEYGVIDREFALKSAISCYNSGISRFSLVTSGKTLNKKEFEKVCRIFSYIKENCPIHLCSSNGLLTIEQLKKLKEIGVKRYHNNLETSRSFFSNICTSHSFDDKVKVIKNAKRVGLEVCSGGIFGLGESLDDRIDLAFTLKSLEVDSVPINILNPIKNTPFENNPKLTYEEVLRSIAIFRFIMPKTSIRLAGGRNIYGDKGELAIEAGIDSMISGNMLTTSGINIKEDITMINKMNFCI
ncbi:biotin synthase BioB [Peptostreptococcus faecalis]|uniref:biotin synthase BioB n=1 Tax=Peptostreptococcus faecalis TaxID=2045015 RepID=UPI002E8E2C1B|nr:biotin synthase BioB [Peptostreptococcus faecalis]